MIRPAEEARALRRTFLERIYQALNGRLLVYVSFPEIGEELGLDLEQAIAVLDHLEGIGCVRVVGTHVELTTEGVEAVEGLDSPPSPPALVFNAPVASVQTGSHATAHVVQNIGEQEHDSLGRVLALLEELLPHVEELPHFPKGQIVELVQETRQELEKATPNQARLTFILGGIATTIQTVSALQPAYVALKGALALLGVPIP